jgi:hypothetical protein
MSRLRLGLWLGIPVVLGGIMLLAPRLIERRVRAQLAQLGDGYRGSLEGISLRLLSAEVAIQGLRIERPHAPHPYLRADELVIGFRLDGARPRTRLALVKPVVNWLDARDDAQDQWGPDFDLKQLREQLPFELDALDVRAGELHLRALDVRPVVDVALRNVDVAWEALAGCLPPGSSACRSQLRGSARPMKDGRLALRGRFERRPQTRLALSGELRGLSAAALGPVLLHYAEVDVQGGTVNLEARYTLRGRRYHGVVVPRLHELEVMGGERDKTRFRRELGLAMAAGFFERRRGEKAVRFEGTKGRSDFDYEIVDNPLAQRDAEKR